MDAWMDGNRLVSLEEEYRREGIEKDIVFQVEDKVEDGLAGDSSAGDHYRGLRRSASPWVV